MKIPIISTILIATLVFTACGGSKNIKLENQDALQIEKASYHKWASGVQGGGWGYNVIIVLKEGQKEKIKLEDVYFKDFKSTFVLNESGQYRAYMEVQQSTLGDFSNIGGSTETNESNKSTEKQHEFELSGDEAILVYLKDGKKKYYKVLLQEDKNVELPR